MLITYENQNTYSRYILNSPAVRKLFLLNSYAFDPLVPTASWVDKLSS